MAASYTLNAQGVTWAAGKNMLAWVNHTGSTVVVDTYRIWMFTLQTATVSGGTALIELWQCNSVSSYTGGSAVTFVSHDTTNPAVPAQVIANAGTTTTLTKNTLLRRWTRITEELAVSASNIQALQSSFPPLNLLWDTGYGGNSIVLPLKLRPGQGLVLFTPATGGGTYPATAATDIVVEMTIY